MTALSPSPAIPITENALLLLPGTADNIAFSPDIDDEKARKYESAIVAWLTQTVDETHTVVCICSGALLAARAGLLDAYACTTHHALCADLAKVAPHSKVLENRLFVIDCKRYTSAGITAGTDLMLHLVSEYAGHPCAVRIARHLVLYLRREGSDPQISPWLDGRNHIHPVIHRIQDLITANPAADWTLQRLAKLAHTSPRHLSRLFNGHAGMTIVEYVNGLRVSLAREMVKGSRLDMERIAERSGFASARQLRRAWKRKYDEAPRVYRS